MKFYYSNFVAKAIWWWFYSIYLFEKYDSIPHFCFLQIANKIGGEDPMHDDSV